MGWQSKQRKSGDSKVSKVNELQAVTQGHHQGSKVSELVEGAQEPRGDTAKQKGHKALAVSSSRDTELYEAVQLLMEEEAKIRRSMSTQKQILLGYS